MEQVLAATTARRILVADSYVAGAETWEPRPWGWETEFEGRSIVNIDHHANDPRFYRHVSSGNLAVEYLRAHGPDPEAAVVINHTDCDAVISSALLAGLLEPRAGYERAVIAADHTGMADPIADLLQALDDWRDYLASLRNLQLLESGKALETAAQDELAVRLRERALAAELVARGAFRKEGKVAVATLSAEDRVSGEFLPPLIPDAWAIVSGSPMENGLWESKIRLGLAAPEGSSLFALGVNTAEPYYGGRWNAGSTKRAGGSPTPPQEVAFQLARQIESIGAAL